MAKNIKKGLITINMDIARKMLPVAGYYDAPWASNEQIFKLLNDLFSTYGASFQVVNLPPDEDVHRPRKQNGCRDCPVHPCSGPYRGSTCAAQRDKFGLDDPETTADRLRKMIASMTDDELGANLGALLDD